MSDCSSRWMPRVTPSPPPQAKPHTDAAAGANLRMENVEEAIRLERLGTAAAARDTFMQEQLERFERRRGECLPAGESRDTNPP
jgi:hypothetical protein